MEFIFQKIDYCLTHKRSFMDNEKSLSKVSDHLFNGISNIINVTRSRVALYVNSQASMMFWHIREFIIKELNYETYSAYGDKILATLSQRLTEKYGKGYSYSALTRMIKVATIYNNEQMFATVSQTLSWGPFYWTYNNKRWYKTIVLPTDGNCWTLERSWITWAARQISVRTLAKGQMELYLKYLKKYEMHPGENPPIGLLLCSEGNTEHIELLMLDEKNIKVAQYLTYLPDKQWFIDKLNRSIMIAKECSQKWNRIVKNF